VDALPANRKWEIIVFGSSPLQLGVDSRFLSGDVDVLPDQDLRAFKLVRDKTGHPNPEEMIRALQRVVDIFRPSFDEESAGNPAHNVRVLWRELFGTDIDVRAKVITPALAERRRVYGDGAQGLKSKLSATKPSK